jgi:hypothetical protein
VPLDIYEPGTKAIIIRTGEYTGFLIESRRPVFPDHDISNWEIVERDPYGLIVYEIDATKPGAMGTLSAVTPDGHDFKYLWRMGRQQPNQVDALFNVGLRLDRMTVVDLFPGTSHVETVGAFLPG